MMADQLFQRREAAIHRHDASLDRWWPDKQHPEFRQDVLSVVKELQDIANQAESSDWPAVEKSRTLRWLADACADLSADEKVSTGEDLAWLSRAASTYLTAETLLQDQDSPRDSAVLNFNFANTLRRFNIENTDFLQSAQRRYQQALEYFSIHEPQQVAHVQHALDSVNLLIQLAPLSQTYNELNQRIERLGKTIESSGDYEETRKEFARILDGGGPRELLAKTMDLIQDMPSSIKQKDKDGKLQGLIMHAMSLSEPGVTEIESEANIMSALRARLQKEINSGKMDAGRADVMRDALESVNKAFISKNNNDLSSLREATLTLRSDAKALLPTLKNMSYGLPLPEKGSSAAQARELLWGPRRYIYVELMQGMLTESEQNILYKYSKKLSDFDKRLVDAATNDHLVLKIETESVRPAISRLRKHLSCQRVYLAEPIWANTHNEINPNALLFIGAEDLKPFIKKWCTKMNVIYLDVHHGRGYANNRWQQIVSANTLIFDITNDSVAQQAAVSYQLGIAMTLGKSVVVVSRTTDKLPFNIDLPPIFLGQQNNSEELEKAMAQSFYWMPEKSKESSIAPSVGEANRRFSNLNKTEMKYSLDELEQHRQNNFQDSVEIARVLESIMSYQSEATTMLITPAWAGKYPEAGQLRLFHVMPFGSEWSDDAASAVERGCLEASARYVRGDRVANPKIIYSIWEEICQASHIVVDITGLNANVAFELGIAHTLGKNVLIVAQETVIEDLFGMIEKYRIAIYQQETLSEELSRMVSQWVSGHNKVE